MTTRGGTNNKLHTREPDTASRRVASFDRYLDARALADRLSHGSLPVEYVRIVGDDVRTVDSLTGTMSKGKAAMVGAACGAWIGAPIGLLFLLFAVGPFYLWVWILVMPIVVGALWGGALGLGAHWSKRDFSSARSLIARRYDVCVDTAYADQAERYLRTD